MDNLLLAARDASAGAYCPYSGFAVGAAVELSGGVVVTGANQECASSSLTICAERVALAYAMSQYPNARVLRIAIFATHAAGITPCGACREFLQQCALRGGAAFGGDNANGGKFYDIEIITPDATYHLSDLLPHPFILP